MCNNYLHSAMEVYYCLVTIYYYFDTRKTVQIILLIMIAWFQTVGYLLESMVPESRPYCGLSIGEYGSRVQTILWVIYWRVWFQSPDHTVGYLLESMVPESRPYCGLSIGEYGSRVQTILCMGYLLRTMVPDHTVGYLLRTMVPDHTVGYLLECMVPDHTVGYLLRTVVPDHTVYCLLESMVPDHTVCCLLESMVPDHTVGWGVWFQTMHVRSLVQDHACEDYGSRPCI